jgi:SRSO17 transposase
MLERAFAHGIPIQWVTADEVYGNDGKLRQWLEENKHPYVLAVACNSRVFLGGEEYEASDLVHAPAPEDWQRLSAGDGSKGPRLYDWACAFLNNQEEERFERFLLIRRSIAKPAEVAYYRVFAPRETPLEEIVRVAGARWAIEECFEMAKSEVGLDQYEVRQWVGWYRHITLAMMALAFLVVVQAQARKKGGTLHKPRSPKTNSLTAFRQQRKIQESPKRLSCR